MIVLDKFNFRYFDNPQENAEFEEEPCEICGNNNNCLSGAYLDTSESEIESVCLGCIVAGKVKIEFPKHLRVRLFDEIKRFNKTITIEEAESKIDKIFEELEKTPPVPWVQYNDWPVCCGDFMKYIGEWEKDDFIKNSEDGDGKNYLSKLIDEKTKARIDSLNVLWDEIGEYTIAFAFECISCKQISIVLQDY